MPLGVDEDEVGGANGGLVDAVERGELRLEGRPAVDRRVLEEEVVVEHDRLRLEAPPREVDVELAHVGDEDDVGVGHLLRLAPEVAPGARDRAATSGAPERLPGGLDPLGRVHLERHVALDELVPVLAQALEEHLHARLLPEAVGAEGDDAHRRDLEFRRGRTSFHPQRLASLRPDRAHARRARRDRVHPRDRRGPARSAPGWRAVPLRRGRARRALLRGGEGGARPLGSGEMVCGRRLRASAPEPSSTPVAPSRCSSTSRTTRPPCAPGASGCGPTAASERPSSIRRYAPTAASGTSAATIPSRSASSCARPATRTCASRPSASRSVTCSRSRGTCSRGEAARARRSAPARAAGAQPSGRPGRRDAGAVGALSLRAAAVLRHAPRRGALRRRASGAVSTASRWACTSASTGSRTAGRTCRPTLFNENGRLDAPARAAPGRRRLSIRRVPLRLEDAVAPGSIVVTLLHPFRLLRPMTT